MELGWIIFWIIAGYLILKWLFPKRVKRRSFTIDEIVATSIRSRGRCEKCGRDRKLSVDHIIPLSKGGDYDLRNLRLLCKYCNSSRGNRSVVR